MVQNINAIGMVALLAGISSSLAQAQSPSPSTIVIDLQNVVEYQGDIADPSRFATNPGVTPSVQPKNFFVVTILGDIVAVNGQPAKGLYAGRSRSIITTTTPNPASVGDEAIADVKRAAIREHIFEILKSDGTAVGTIVSLGFSGGPAPPGTPSTERANWAIVGGSGAFLGARGQVSGTGAAGRTASMAEDPANRRVNGGTSLSLIIHVIPMWAPQIVTTASGPAIVHSTDFSLVTASKPAVAGEILSLFATGLGPAVGVDIGQAFPLSPLAAVNSPVTVTVNGKPAEVLAATGYPGAVDGYQVNFRLPTDAGKGLAAIQVGAAWIAGASVSIAVQ
jgi:uncharacterized protein (TIGR03437 family)